MSEPNLRRAVRAVVLDDRDRVLLVRFDFPERSVWATPGGGIEPDEGPEDALRRELIEEAGLTHPEIGPRIWTRTHHFEMGTGHDGQREPDRRRDLTPLLRLAASRPGRPGGHRTPPQPPRPPRPATP